MADARTPGSRSSPAALDGVPREVALDQPFRTGDLYLLRAAVAAHASALGGLAEQVDSLVVVASELATNAVVHGGGHGRLLLWRVDNRIALQVSDQGSGFADAAAAGTTPQAPAATGGRGLWIARRLCDRVAIEAGPTGTVVTVSLSVQPSVAGPA
jgi:anti-sigma regulatory factor (Ser/Thr protein kinase)